MNLKKLALIMIWLLTIQIALATVISLTTTISTVTMTGKSSIIQVKLLNSGDETAYNVQFSLINDSFNADKLYVGNLDLNIPFDGNLTITKTKEILPGNYLLVFLTDYADANGYPFSSISRTDLTYKTPSKSLISGNFGELTLSGKQIKKLVLSVKNLDSTSHEVKVRLFLPRELKSDNDNRVLSIPSKEEKKLDFDVSSFSALAGSSYVVLASLEYDENNEHYSSLAQTMIRITEDKGISFNLPSWLPIIVVVGLIAVFVYFQFRKGKKQ